MLSTLLKIVLFLPLYLCVFSSQAKPIGDTLKPLNFKASPFDFFYEPNGKLQLITVYPAKMASKEAGEFNIKFMAKGLCPLSITDIKNKAWYAPVSMIEEEIKKSLAAESHKAECLVSADYDGIAARSWALKSEPTTIVVDGQGSIIFFAYGPLNEGQQETVFNLFFNDANVPYGSNKTE